MEGVGGEGCQAYWMMHVTLALKRLKQWDYMFEANLSYIGGSRPAWDTKQDFVSK